MAVKVKDLKAKREALLTELRAIHDKPAGEGGDLSGEQRTRFDAIKTEVDNLDAQITRQEFIDDLDRRASGQPITGSGDGQFDAEVRKFSLRAAIAMMVPDIAQGVDFGREREISAELQRRGMVPSQGGVMVPMQVFEQRVITTAAPGGGPGSNLVATDHMGNQFIDILRAKMITRGLGARVLGGLQGNVSIPGLKASGTAEWIAENAALTGGDQQFRSVTMAPKHVGAMTEFSRNMLLQTSPDIEQLIRADFADLLAQALDKAAIKGGGANEPSGVLSQAIGAFIGGDWIGILSALENLGIANADAGSLAWATNPKVVRKLRSTLKVSGDAAAGFIMDKPDELAGYRLAVSNNVPSNLPNVGSPTVNNASALIFGNWLDLLIGYWSATEILVNPFEATAYSKGNVKVRALLTADIAVRHLESFVAYKTFDTNEEE